MSSDALGVAVAAQRRRVPKMDRPAFERAVLVLHGLIEALGLAGFAGSVVQDGKPRLLLRFAAAPGFAHGAVLKVYGDRPRGEGPLLAAWGACGVPTPLVRYGEAAGGSWLLLEYLDLTPVDLSSSGACAAMTDMLASWGDVMHAESSEAAPFLRSLPDVMLPRWRQAIGALRRVDAPVQRHWAVLAERSYAHGPARPLHGDLAAANLGIAAGRLVIFDASALAGPAAFDAARWAARLARFGVDPRAAYERWAEREGLGPAGALLGVECVLEAGALIAAHPDVAEALLRVAAALLDENETLAKAASRKADQACDHGW
ncbi:phosphotransferase [Actinoplanes missouriensis]|uniref:phosphotransferase n=1 Tax=Actinoplanes missouriensis TaxID=1866 RepID=UPI001E3BC5CA|nr:phosphotransferase [Actinoplanes missouriensis]